jgi:hypothetical protein
MAAVMAYFISVFGERKEEKNLKVRYGSSVR